MLTVSRCGRNVRQRVQNISLDAEEGYHHRMVDKKIFTGEMINASATEYCASKGTRLSDYELRGVFMKGGYTGSTIFESFRRDVPPEAEVVTNIQYLGMVTGESFFYAARRLEVIMGTALIRKPEPSPDPIPQTDQGAEPLLVAGNPATADPAPVS